MTKRKPVCPQDALQLETIFDLVQSFCKENLNEEYLDLCIKLAEKLSRKRPSPLLRGKPESWASGIVRTIGWVNYLDDSSNSPHMKLTAIDKAFGIAESTGQGKSAEIRRMFRIKDFDPDWTLPSQLASNPYAWLIEVDGFIMDARNLPQHVQQQIFEMGLIPYLPNSSS